MSFIKYVNPVAYQYIIDFISNFGYSVFKI
jgi:hypothetical protein